MRFPRTEQCRCVFSSPKSDFGRLPTALRSVGAVRKSRSVVTGVFSCDDAFQLMRRLTRRSRVLRRRCGGSRRRAAVHDFQFDGFSGRHRSSGGRRCSAVGPVTVGESCATAIRLNVTTCLMTAVASLTTSAGGARLEHGAAWTVECYLDEQLRRFVRRPGIELVVGDILYCRRRRVAIATMLAAAAAAQRLPVESPCNKDNDKGLRPE